MDGTIPSDTKQHFFDPVELVRYHLGREAAAYATQIRPGPYDTVFVIFPEGSMTAQVSLQYQTVDLWLPRWAQALGWTWDHD